MFVGNGFDIHKHSKDENLILGGINIDGDGFEAHSDGDIILHSPVSYTHLTLPTKA